MIYGIGCDTVEIERIEKSAEREGFLRYVYSEVELSAFKGDIKRLAGNFAAKEAIAKALGTGIRGFSLSSISVLRDELGKPYYVFTGELLKMVEANGLKAHLSITNTAQFASAFAVLEKGGEL